MPNNYSQIATIIDESRSAMVAFQQTIIPTQAVGPDNGGPGEAAKAALVEKELRTFCDEVRSFSAPDARVLGGMRPNVLGVIHGRDRGRTLWLIAHLDVVPAGDLAAWQSPPFEPRITEGRIYGRGAEDNGQGLTAILFAGKTIKSAGLVPPTNVGLLFCADEETGNQMGIQHILAEANIFRSTDAAVIPDGGTPNRIEIEVAEKGIALLKVTVQGQSAHGSMPHLGVNAARAAARFIVQMDELYRLFPERDPLFDPPHSTFEPTRREENIPNINAIPGKEVCYFDCRLLPSLSRERFLAESERIAQAVAGETGTTITLSTVASVAASRIDPNAVVVRNTQAAVETVYGERVTPFGVGGGTIAAYLRAKGIPAVVYGRCDGTLHGANEYCVIDYMVNDAKVLAIVALSEW